MSESSSKNLLALADFLIPEHGQMPRFSAVCTQADALAALNFRIDLKDAFARAISGNIAQGEEAYLESLYRDDDEAFTALATILVCTYYMNPSVRALIGYPGQENVAYDTYATQGYVTDGSLAKVVARGRKYRPTPDI
jgi:hypothetical protein